MHIAEKSKLVDQARESLRFLLKTAAPISVNGSSIMGKCIKCQEHPHAALYPCQCPCHQATTLLELLDNASKITSVANA